MSTPRGIKEVTVVGRLVFKPKGNFVLSGHMSRHRTVALTQSSAFVTEWKATCS